MNTNSSKSKILGVDFLGDILEQTGVKGMRWGVRKTTSSSSSSPATKTSSKSEDATTAQANRTQARTHGVSSLTNKQLQDYITRANLEQQYSKLSISKKEAGAKRTKEFLTEIGKNTVRSVVGGVLTSAVKTVLGLNAK